MPSGKSSERLAEELGVIAPGALPLFSMNPIEVYKLTVARQPDTEFAGFCLPGLPLWPKVFNGFFAASRQHLQIESDRNLQEDGKNGIERDWQVVDSSPEGNIVILECGLSGARLTVNIFPTEIPQNVRSTFSYSSLQNRLHKFGSTTNAASSGGTHSSTPSGSTTTESWELLARIVNDLLSTSPEDRRSISNENPKPARLLDMHTVLPMLGFTFDSSTQLFRPPRSADPEFMRWLRRVLLEIRLETTGMRFREPLVPAVSRFLGFQPLSGDAYLSPPAYACLGAVITFSDDRVLTRFELAWQNDSVKGGPYYLESLKSIAQQTRSELLETRVIELMSLGTPSLSNLEESFAKLGLSLETQEQLSDDQLAETVLNIPPSQENQELLAAIATVRPTQIWQRASAATTMLPDEALRVFSTDTVDPATIAERFKTIWEYGAAIDKLEARYGLRSLALSTRSTQLLALYESVLPASTQSNMSYSNALTVLGLSSEVDDEDSVAIFEANLDDVDGERLLEMRRALAVVAEERQSRFLFAYLGHLDSVQSTNSGSDKLDLIDLTSEEPRGPRLPVGLWNIGNTCYLNSLLQFYYSLPRVREYVTEYTIPESEREKHKEGENDMNEENTIDAIDSTLIDNEATAVKAASTGDGDDDANNTDGISNNETTSNTDETAQAKGVGNGNSDDSDKNENETKKTVGNNFDDDNGGVGVVGKKIGGRVVSPSEIKRSQIFVDRLGKLFRQISNAPAAHITPSEMLAYMALVPPQEDAEDVIAASGPEEENILRGRLIGALQRQQDVTECIENVLDQLEATMPASSVDPEDGEQNDLIKELFYGTTVQTLARVSSGENRRTKTERFSSLLLDVNDGPTNIYDSLDNYFADDVLQLEDGDTLRTLRLKSVPEILQVQVQRVQFDKTTYLPYKNINPLIFPEEIYLDRYFETPAGSDLDRRNMKVKEWKQELKSIEQQLDKGGILVKRRNALRTTLAWFKQQQSTGSEATAISEATLQTTTAHYEELCRKAQTLEARQAELQAALAREFDDLTQFGYRCHSLFIHKGDVSYGHYWIYIRDTETGEFHKYNDEIVSKVSREEVFDFSEHNLATPYFLVFVRI